MKKLLLSCAALVGLCAYAQDAPLYTAVGYPQAAGYDGYVDFVPETDVVVEAYEDYVVLKGWAGVEGYDLKVGFDAEENVTFLQSGEGEKFSDPGYTGWIYTGIPKAESNFYAVMSYIGSSYSNAASDPETESGYVSLFLYSSKTDTEANEYAYYYLPWGSSDEAVIIGNEDNSTPWWSAWSDNLGFEGNGSMHYEFYNYSNCQTNWNNWLLVLTNAPYTPNDGEIYGIEQELVVFRADNYGWGPLYESSTLENNYNWETFKDEMDQAWVELDITREGQTVKVHAVTYTVGDKEYTYDMTVNGVTSEYLGSFLTVEGGHLAIYDAYVEDVTGIASVANDANAPVAYYNLQGMPVSQDNMTTGIYIMRQGNNSQKVLIRK